MAVAGKERNLGQTLRILREGRGSRPEVRLVQNEHGLAVIKDYSSGNWVLRVLGLVLISRERRAYRRLEKLKGIPRWFEQPDPYIMCIQYVESKTGSGAPVDLLTPAFFDRLAHLIGEMHRLGVAHGDLKRLDNILVTPEGEPYLIDFSAAFWNGSNPLSAFVMPYLIDDDNRAIYKLKYRRVKDLLTPEEEAFMNARGPLERVWRIVREWLRKPVQHLAETEPE
ncbi:MAG: hypothetical protein ABFE07_20505 [Armatimonadia bacterium]